MHNLALAQELDGVAHIGIIRKAQYVVLRYAEVTDVVLITRDNFKEELEKKGLGGK